MGREKFTEFLLAPFAWPAWFVFSGGGLTPRFCAVLPTASTLAPRPPTRVGWGDCILFICGSKLEARLCCVGVAFIVAGTAGTGGASGSILELPFPAPGRCGEGERNERSVMEPLLFVRCRPGLAGDIVRLPLALPCDEVEFRRTMRFVCMLPGCVGGGVWDRSAAAAAAEESEALEFAFLTNA